MDKRKQIDFLACPQKPMPQEFEKYSEKKRGFFTIKKIAPTIIVFIIFLSLAYTTRAVISSNEIAQQFGDTTILEQLKHLISSDNRKIQGEEKGRINLLLLGIGGENHEGGQLTDTIIVASMNPQTGEMGMLSIPRDLVAPIKGVGWQKINSAHAHGYKMAGDDPKAGSELAKKTVEDVVGLNIDYYIKIDFAGFVKIVDALGGVRVEVASSFTDYEYPDENYGYAPVHFDQGWQNLSGDEALKYARSRHGTDGEGSDFARARRQQQIINALQLRATALSTLLNPNKMLSLADIIGTHVETNMEVWEIIRLYEIAKEIGQNNIQRYVLSTKQEGLLSVGQTEDNAYILVPRAGQGNFSEIQKLASNIMEKEQPKPENIQEKTSIKIAIQNGTKSPGLAAKTADQLKKLSYQISQISNAQNQDYEKTVIYKLSENPLPDDMQIIREALNANIAQIIPESLAIPDADILIIVGEDNV